MNHHSHATLAPPRIAKRARHKPVVLLALCLGVLVAQVDTSVVNLAMQPIGSAFRASVTELQWVLDAYNLVYATLLLTGGLIADLYGRRLAFQIGAAILIVASLGCALSPSVDFLIAARAVAGLGSALLLPASLAIVRVVFTDQAERRRALGVWASCNGLAFVIGPTLGGFCIAWFGWPSVFLLVVPLALAAFVLAAVAVPESSDAADRHEDFPGQILGAIVLGGVVYVGIVGLGGDGASLLALLLSAIAFPLFVLVEDSAQGAALVPLDLFRNRSFCGAIVVTASMTFGIYGVIFLVPLVWQSSGFLTAQAAGLALMPCALALFLIAPRSGHMAQRVGVRVMTAGGTALIACGLFVLAATQGGRPFLLAQVGLVLAGIGMGINTGPLMSVAVDAVSAARSGTASALINVARMTGATFGVAFLGTAFAMWPDGAEGLRAAMLIGAAAQLCGAFVAWLTIR
jgi:MFS transporter, DHA2 family, methylenomycin A resistance protein